MKRKVNRKKVILVVIILIILIIFILIGTSLARYYSRLDGNIYTKIANPIVELHGEQSLAITALYPKASYNFEVRNYNNQDVNEVEMEYYIEIISQTDESIQFELYNDKNNKIELEDNKTDKISIGKEDKANHIYRLDITYLKDKSESKIDINENIEIKIYSIQKV